MYFAVMTLLIAGLSLDHSLSTTSFEVGIEEEDGVRRPLSSVTTKSEAIDTNYSWEEWAMMNQGQNSSAINVPGMWQTSGQGTELQCHKRTRYVVNVPVKGQNSSAINVLGM